MDFGGVRGTNPLVSLICLKNVCWSSFIMYMDEFLDTSFNVPYNPDDKFIRSPMWLHQCYNMLPKNEHGELWMQRKPNLMSSLLFVKLFLQKELSIESHFMTTLHQIQRFSEQHFYHNFTHMQSCTFNGVSEWYLFP